jgi:hypothetical protein
MDVNQRGPDETVLVRGQANQWHIQKTSSAAKQVHPQDCSSSAVPLRSSQPPRRRNQQLSEKMCRVLLKFVNLVHIIESSASYVAFRNDDRKIEMIWSVSPPFPSVSSCQLLQISNVSSLDGVNVRYLTYEAGSVRLPLSETAERMKHARRADGGSFLSS